MYGKNLVVKIYTYVKQTNYFAFIQKVQPEVFYKTDVRKHFRSSRPVRLRSATLLKMRLWRMCFPVNFAKFLRIPFTEYFGSCLWHSAKFAGNTVAGASF